MEAAEIIRSLVDTARSRLRSGRSCWNSYAFGQNEKPRRKGGVSRETMVAGGRNRGNSRSVKMRVVQESDVAEIATRASAILNRSRRLQSLCIAEA